MAVRDKLLDLLYLCAVWLFLLLATASTLSIIIMQKDTGTLLVVGLPETGRLRVQRRDGQQTTLRDVYGAPELLHAAPGLPTLLSATLPHNFRRSRTSRRRSTR